MHSTSLNLLHLATNGTLRSGPITVSPDDSPTPKHQVVTCGFEDIDEPADAEEAQGRHLPGYRFRHHGQLRLMHTLQREMQGPGDDAVLRYYDVTLYRGDIRNLREDEWLNDNNICYLYEYLDHTLLDENTTKRILLMRPSMSYLLQQSSEPESLREVLPPLGGTTQMVFLPINDNPDVSHIEGGNHWSLVVLIVPLGVALVYDTLHGTNTRAAKRTIANLEKLLDKKLETVIMPTPQQATGSDCGVLVCEISALLVHRAVKTIKRGKELDITLDGITLVASAGRSFMLTTILQLIQSRRDGDTHSIGRMLRSFSPSPSPAAP